MPLAHKTKQTANADNVKNITASSIECYYVKTKHHFKNKNMRLTRFFVVALNSCHTSSDNHRPAKNLGVACREVWVHAGTSVMFI